MSPSPLPLTLVSQDKRQQTSDWQARPLSHAQQVYAALDALCLVAVFDRLIAHTTLVPLTSLFTRAAWTGEGVAALGLPPATYVPLRLHHHATAHVAVPAAHEGKCCARYTPAELGGSTRPFRATSSSSPYHLLTAVA
jgi:hypothetical protein